MSQCISNCVLCVYQGGESKLLWCPSMDWHRGFRPWTMEAAAFHSNWTIKQLIELISTLICTRGEELISEIICCSGVDSCTSMDGGWQHHLTYFSKSLRGLPTNWGWAGFAWKQHGTKWSEDIYIQQQLSPWLRKWGGQLSSSTSIHYVSIKKSNGDRRTHRLIQIATQVNPQWFRSALIAV